ncbi:uncharacterized protein BP01DRAFT_307091, partial [Aspergillus saccharolyticus JOP 1030-1]
PREITDSIINQLINIVYKNRASQLQIYKMMAFKLDILIILVYYILKKYSFKLVKPTKKPGLTPEIKKRRLEFCLYGLKDLIFTDKTIVYIDQYCGTQRIWYYTYKKYKVLCIQYCWKSKADFMV